MYGRIIRDDPELQSSMDRFLYSLFIDACERSGTKCRIRRTDKGLSAEVFVRDGRWEEVARPPLKCYNDIFDRANKDFLSDIIVDGDRKSVPAYLFISESIMVRVDAITLTTDCMEFSVRLVVLGGVREFIRALPQLLIHKVTGFINSKNP